MNKTFSKQYGEKHVDQSKILNKSTDPLFEGPPTNERVMANPKL